MRARPCVCVLLMHEGNDSQLLCLNREHIWRKGRGKDSKEKWRKEENMLAYHKVNVISCLFVLQYSISDSGAALENIWKTASLPCTRRQSYLCMLLQIAWTWMLFVWFVQLHALRLLCFYAYMILFSRFICARLHVKWIESFLVCFPWNSEWKSCSDLGRLELFMILELIIQKSPQTETLFQSMWKE